MQRKGAAAEHGTMARYRRGCRCELCRAAKAIGRLPQEHRELWALLADPGDPRHGTTTGYRVGCRCERCREAKSAAKARYLDEKRFDRLTGAGEGRKNEVVHGEDSQNVPEGGQCESDQRQGGVEIRKRQGRAGRPGRGSGENRDLHRACGRGRRERAAGIKVEELLRSMPGIGKRNAERIMALCEIAPNRRVRGLGRRQRERLGDAVAHWDPK